MAYFFGVFQFYLINIHSQTKMI